MPWVDVHQINIAFNKIIALTLFYKIGIKGISAVLTNCIQMFNKL